MNDHPAQRHWRPECRCEMQPCINRPDLDCAVLDAADKQESRHSYLWKGKVMLCGCGTCVAVRARREANQ